jgi:hypothetical protein
VSADTSLLGVTVDGTTQPLIVLLLILIRMLFGIGTLLAVTNGTPETALSKF